MPSNGYTLSIECILKEAKFRWLKGYEVLCILQNYQTYGLQLSTAAPIDPQSGSLFLFNKRLVKFRKDGINWKKQKDGKTVRESHEKLKVGGVKVLSCCYTRSADNSAFQRRIYWLLDGDPTTVLVHYLLLEKDSAAFAHGSGENETDARSFPVHSGLLHNESGEDKEPDSASDPSGDEVEQSNPTEFNFGTIPSQNNPLNESLMDFVNSLISPDHHASPVGSLGTVPHYPNTAVHNGLSQQEHLVNLQPTPAPSQPLPSASCLGRLAKVTDFSPEWDYMEGGAKVIITGPDFQRGINYYCMFDQMEVQAEVVLDGVLRCRVPPHSTAGFVSFCITRGNFVLFSEVKHFEYRKRELSAETQLSLNDRSFKLRIIERLERLEREVNSSNSISTFTLSQSMMDNLSKMLEDKFLNEEQLEQVFTKILANLVELLDHKEFINGQDKDGFTLLHCACALRYHLLAQTLIQWGVNVNLQDITGNTPFHWAMKNRDQKMMKVLVDYVDLNKSAYNQMDFSSNKTNSTLINNGGIPSSSSSVQSSTSSSSVEGIASKIDDMGLRLNPDAAATTIQSAFRGWRVREELSEKDDPTSPQQDNRDRFWDRLETTTSKANQSSSSSSSTTPSPDNSGVRMRLAVRQRETKKKEHEAAKKIQVAFKDYKTRRMQQNVSDSQKRSHDARSMRVTEKRK